MDRDPGNLNSERPVEPFCRDFRRNIPAPRNKTGRFSTVIFRQAAILRLTTLASHICNDGFHACYGREAGARRIFRYLACRCIYAPYYAVTIGRYDLVISTDITLGFGYVTIRE